MYICNIESIDDKFLYKCNKSIAMHLIKEGFMYCSKKNDIYYFYKTDSLLKQIAQKGGD